MPHQYLGSDLAVFQVVLLSEAYLTALIPSYKKRICQFCLEDHQKRLSVSCSKAYLCCKLCTNSYRNGSNVFFCPNVMSAMHDAFSIWMLMQYFASIHTKVRKLAAADQYKCCVTKRMCICRGMQPGLVLLRAMQSSTSHRRCRSRIK